MLGVLRIVVSALSIVMVVLYHQGGGWQTLNMQDLSPPQASQSGGKPPRYIGPHCHSSFSIKEQNLLLSKHRSLSMSCSYPAL